MHYNIQINVQQVGMTEGTGATALRRSQTPTTPRKTVVEVLSLKVVARTEQEAYAKAMLMLRAATPKLEDDPEPIEGGPEDEEEDF